MNRKASYAAAALGVFFVIIALLVASPVILKRALPANNLAQVSSGTNFFVTPGGGSSSPQDGSSWNHAWPGTSAIKWGTGAGQLGAGDTLWMAGGTYGAFSIGANGSAGSPITIKRATASFPTAINSPGWQSSYDSQIVIAVPTCNGCQGIYGAPPNSDYITIDGSVDNGIKFTEAPSGLNTYTTQDNERYGIKITGNGNIFKYFEVAGPGAPSSARGVYAGDNYHYGWKTGLTIDHCYVHDISVGIFVGDITNILIQNCNIGPTLSSAPNHDDSIYIFSGDGTVRYNYFHDYPVEGLYFCSQFPPGPNNWKIYGNIFNNNGNMVNGQSLTFDPSSQTTPIQQYQYGSGWQIFNNTFLNSYMGLRTDSRWPAAFSSAVAGGTVSNNIFWNASGGFGSMTGTNNLFNTSPVQGGSAINANNQNPFVNMAGGDFHITSATGTLSPRNNGSTLATEFNTDKDGNTRGADGVWDIGAYEYSSGGGGGGGGGGTTPTTYTLTVSNSGTGSGSVAGGAINCGSTCSTTVNSGTIITLAANPAAGSTFTTWGGACAGNSSTCNVTVNGNTSVTATFTANTATPDYTTGLVARYSFDNASNLGNDDSGNGNSGTVNGSLTTVAGKIGTAVNFTSAPQNISIAKDLIGTGPTTICAWIDPASYGFATVGRGRIIDNGSTIFYMEPLSANFSISSDGVNDTFSANSSAVLNQWIHVCAARSSGTATLYVNGTVSGTANSANGTPAAGTPTLIGNSAGLTRGFSGAMDDLRIYNRALSATDVAGLYAATIQPIVTTSVLTVSNTGSGSGIVTGGTINCGSTCSATVNTGTVVALTASPNSGSTFSGWGGACSGTGATCNVTVSSATNVTATFTAGIVQIPLMPSLTFAATAGLIQSPFIASGGVVSQNVSTPIISGNGQASYQFTISQAGNYIINATVNAVDDSSNSFFVNIDSLPTVSDVWNIPFTSGLQQSTVGWGGASTGGAPAQVFNLTAGVHTLYILGREVNVQISSITIAPQVIAQSPDTTSPTISITSPSAGTISGSVSLSATAADPVVANQVNSGVATVQFLLDGSNIGSALTAPPYSGTWNTVGVSNGAHTITAVATDGAGNKTTSSAVSVTVNNFINVPPVMAAIPAKSVNENSLLTFTVSATDGNNDTLTYSASGLPAGATFNAGTQTFSWTPTFAQSGVYNVTFTADDGHGGNNSQNAVITVLNVNRPPVANAGNNQTITLPGTATLSGSGSSDPDSNPVTYQWSQVSGPLASISNSSAVSPSVTLSGGAGTYVFSLTVSDGSLQSSSQVAITAVQSLPPDTDGDGVNDVVDACPGTPPALYSSVNLVGCPLPIASTFTITNLSNVNLNSVASLDISNSFGKISFTSGNGPYSLVANGGTARVNIDANVSINQGSASMVSGSIPQLNKPATITLNNITVVSPEILRDGILCSTCVVTAYSNNNLVFMVPGFSTYTVVATPVSPVTPPSNPSGGGSSSSGGGGSGGSAGTGPSTGTFTPSASASAPVSPAASGGNPPAIGIGVAVNTISTVNVRSYPGTSALIKTTAVLGTSATIIGGPVSANGYTWWQVSLSNGTTGWSVSNYLSTGSASPLLGGMTTSALSATPSGSAVTISAVNFRSSPSTSATIKSVLAKGASVTITGTSVTGSGYTWLPVKLLNGSAGWVVKTYLRVPAVSYNIGDNVTTIGKVNVRSAAGTTNRIITVAIAGTALTIQGGPVSASGYTWWQVNLPSGGTGWVAGSYISR